MKKSFWMAAAFAVLVGCTTTGHATTLERQYDDYVYRNAYFKRGQVKVLTYRDHVPGWKELKDGASDAERIFSGQQPGIPYLDLLGRCWFNSPCRA